MLLQVDESLLPMLITLIPAKMARHIIQCTI